MYAMIYIIENGCRWMALPKKYGEWHIVYVKFNRWSKNGIIAGILLATKKQKLFNKGNSVFFIDSTNIKISRMQTGVEILKTEYWDVQKMANNEATSILYSFIALLSTILL